MRAAETASVAATDSKVNADVCPFDIAALNRTFVRSNDLLLACIPEMLPDSGAIGRWWAYSPMGLAVTSMGSPTVEMVEGERWVKNSYGTYDRFIWDGFSNAIPCSGASIIISCRPLRCKSDTWQTLVDVFFDRVMLGIDNNTGELLVFRNGTLDHTGALLPSGEVAVVSLVVQPSGSYQMWTNGVPATNSTAVSVLTNLVPNVPGPFANDISIGNNGPDGWSSFNGHIGNVAVYAAALTDSERGEMEKSFGNAKSLDTNDFYPSGTTATEPERQGISNIQVGEGKDGRDGARPSTGTVVLAGSAIPGTGFPVSVAMQRRPQGVYYVDAAWGGMTQRTSYIYFPSVTNLTETQRWWIHLVGEKQAEVSDLFERYRTDEDFARKFSGHTVRAYRSKIDGTLQPYAIDVPGNLAGKENCPMVVVLEATQGTREEWSLGHLQNQTRQAECIVMTPHLRGGAPHQGLVEQSVFEAIDDACRVFKIDRRRIILEGECAGGAGCWQLAARYPGRFAAIVPYGDFDYSILENGIVMNLRNVSVWHQQPEFYNPEAVSIAVQQLQSLGADAKLYINKGAGKGSYDGGMLAKMRAWALEKISAVWPTQVMYRTYGDIDGAYWVRGIMPERFGRPATVWATVREKRDGKDTRDTRDEWSRREGTSGGAGNPGAD